MQVQDMPSVTRKSCVIDVLNLVHLERIEGFIGIANERKTHFSLLLLGHCANLCSVRCACVFLRNLINGEVGHIDIGAKSGLEWCTNVA